MIRDLQKGDRLTADYIRGLVREVRRNRVAAGHGLRLTETPNGAVISLAQHPFIPRPVTGNYYPFGAQYPFGISIDGAAVTVHAQVIYRGGVPLKLAESTVTITADYDWAVLKIVPAASEGEDTLSLVRMADAGGYPPGDDQGNGWILRGLHQFRLANGAASWHKAGWVGADLGMMGY